MTIGHFIWTDLSTYDVRSAKRDYAMLFGWSFQRWRRYAFATLDNETVAAVFRMPKRLAKMKMPSFWMSYIHVESVEETVAKASAHEGAIIEVQPEKFGSNAKVALIRDPSGAGFTVYEGPEIKTPRDKPGVVVQRYHHLPGIDLIQSFYSDLFGWRFEKTSNSPWSTYDILHADGERIAIAEEVPEAICGTFRYWMPCFRVGSAFNVQKTLRSIKGGLRCELMAGRLILEDRQQAHFMIESASDHVEEG
ncbi:MAG: VOC family protein [Pseudomonadota bacterium]